MLKNVQFLPCVKIAANLADVNFHKLKNSCMENSRKKSRREFIQSGARLSLAIALGGIAGLAASKAGKENWVWQIDPFKCTQCGRCATSCVMKPSAAKCMHAFALCGY